MTIRDLLMSLILVFGQNLPLLQLITTFIFFTIQTALIMYLKPLKSKKSNIIEFINTTFQLIIVTILGLIIFSENKMTSKNISLYYGLPIFILLVTLFLINYFVEVFFSLKFIIKKIIKITKNLSKKTKKAKKSKIKINQNKLSKTKNNNKKIKKPLDELDDDFIEENCERKKK